MSEYFRSPRSSWPSSDEITCLLARRFLASLRPWIERQSRHCAQCFSKTCSLGHWKRRREQEGYGTGKEPDFQVFDVDGTRQAVRQRALPSTPDLPVAKRRLDEVCAPSYTGRKWGETVRTRTTVLQAHKFGSSGQAEQETVVFSSLPFSRCVLLSGSVSPYFFVTLLGFAGTELFNKSRASSICVVGPLPCPPYLRCASRGNKRAKK